MLRRMLLFALVLTTPLDAAPNEPSSAQIQRAAEACTVQGAFGIGFSHKWTGPSSTTAAAEWSPFQTVLVQPDRETGKIVKIEAAASFEKALMSNEDRIALADWVFRALDAKIQSRHSFMREARPEGIRFIAPADSLTLALSRQGAVVRLACAIRP